MKLDYANAVKKWCEQWTASEQKANESGSTGGCNQAGESLADVLAHKIREIEIIISLRNAIDAKRAKLQKEYDEARKTLSKEQVELEKRCPHDFTTYEADASGNNDSYYHCEVCGNYA